MEFFDVSMWILFAAVTLWSIQRKLPNPRFKIRISVVLFSVALFPVAYALVYPGAEIVGLMVLPSLIFFFLGAFALLREQEAKHRRLEPEPDESQPTPPSGQPAGDGNLSNAANGQSNAPAFIMWGAIILATAIYSYVSTLIGCPDGPNTGGSVVAEGEIQHSSVVNGMSCFWAVPLSGFWGVVGGLSGITLLVLGIVRLRASKR